MYGWIYGILAHFPGIIKKAGKWILDRIWSVFDDGLRFARWIKSGVQAMIGGGKNVIRGIRDALTETYWTVKWIILTEIPRRAKRAFDDAIKWAGANLNWLRGKLEGAISTLERWAKQAISTLKGWAENAVKWLTNNVNSLIANVKKLLDRVFGTWSTPLRLAEWAIGAIWTVALRYAYSNRERIARWFIQSSAAFAQFIARTIEQLLVRLL